MIYYKVRKAQERPRQEGIERTGELVKFGFDTFAIVAVLDFGQW